MHQTRLPIELPQPATATELRQRTHQPGADGCLHTGQPARAPRILIELSVEPKIILRT